MDIVIKNGNDLREEIARLKGLESEQCLALKERFSSPGAVFSSLYSLFPKSAGSGEDKSNIFNQDFVSILSRILLPLTLNKTLFKHSGFLVKTLVGLLSQKASGYINEEAVTGIWDKLRSLFNKKDKVKGHYPYSL